MIIRKVIPYSIHLTFMQNTIPGQSTDCDITKSKVMMSEGLNRKNGAER